MILEIADGRMELKDHANLRSFQVRARGSRYALDHIRQALAGRVAFPDEAMAWVAEDTLRQWPTLSGNTDWQHALTAMIEKARSHGWIDPATGAIKAHVEWPDEDAVPDEHDAEALRDGLKQAMRRLASTVTIITANEEGVPHGMLATAVISVTMDPPSIAICVNQNASIHDPLLRTRAFCVNLLRPAHETLCGDFSGRKSGQDRFTAEDWVLSGSAPPHLVESQASVFCAVDGELSYGTHTIIVGRVTKVVVADEVAPLLYQNALYGRFMPLSS